MREKKIEITVADMAEQAMALNEFYRQRVLGVQAMRRTEAEQVKVLTEALAAAEAGLAEVSEEIAKLTPPDASKSGKAN
jgi:tetrahydromethanopterin S-methyltransferase subunit H